MIADLITEGLQSGFADFKRPATPETCGHDMDVPERKAYGERRVSSGTPVVLTSSENAASMFTPGAVTSGCKKYIYTQHNKNMQWVQVFIILHSIIC